MSRLVLRSTVLMRTKFPRDGFIAITIWLALLSGLAGAQSSIPGRVSSKPVADSSNNAQIALIHPQELASLLKAGNGTKPLMFHVGFRVLYQQAHIPESEYLGPGSDAEGIRQLHTRVDRVPRTRNIVLYCGCCPWEHCPNVHPAYDELRKMGFKNVKVLYIAHDFGTDWVSKGYPTAKGE
jgi:rhodanese-related sulfurtransferase